MRYISVWLQAFRLRTLPLAFSVPLIGSCLGYADSGFRWSVCILAVLTTLFLQILSNLANDYGDTLNGADSSGRVGPQRVTQSGLVSHRQMLGMIVAFSLLSVVSGVLLLLVGLSGKSPLAYGAFGVLGLAAVVASITYTMGDKPYGYKGGGDVMVFVFFGLVGVAGTYYLHVGDLCWSVLLPASSIGLLSVGVLNINNLRDHIGDAASGKRTMVVRFGVPWGRHYQLALVVCALCCAVWYTCLHYRSIWQFLFLLTVPLFALIVRSVYMERGADRLTLVLKRMAMATFVFALLFGVGVIL